MIERGAEEPDTSILQILVQHIKNILPDMKARVSAQMVTLAKELASYGELTESKVSYYAIWSLFLGCRGFTAI